MFYIIPLAVFLFTASCGDEKPVAVTDDPIQTIELGGNSYRLAAGKTNTSDLSIQLSYAIRGGVAHIDAVTIDGVEYRADCSGPQPPPTTGSSRPHYADCADGQGTRDVDFTCDGYSDRPPLNTHPDKMRLKVEGNEEYLRQRFESAFELEVPVPYDENIFEGDYTSVSYNLSD